MNNSPRGSDAHLRSPSPERTDNDRCNSLPRGTKIELVSVPSPSDPTRQARRLPIRILKMLSTHSSILLHPEYLQPLTSAPVSIELDAKKSPLALLAQTCSQIGKPDPPSSSKLGSLSSISLSDKESSGRSSSSGHKSGEQHQSLEDKSSFKPYNKTGGECRKDGLVTKGATDKAGFRVPSGGSGSSGSCPSFPPHSTSPSSTSPPLHSQGQSHRQTQSPSTQQQTSHSQALHIDNKPVSSDQASSDSSTGKKDSDHSKEKLDGAQLANSSHMRASANSSNASSASSPRPESKADPQSSQSGLGSGHIAPVSPFKPGHSVFPMPPSSMGYHGSIVGAYAGYPSQFMDHTKASLGMGIPGKHPSSSPLTGASPPSLMQGLCRDPYCLTYPNHPHLGGSNCNTCVHDPSTLKSGYQIMYPSHHLHSLHPSSLSSTTPTLSHPLYTYGYMLQNEPQPHACNWVSVGGPCDKRFSTSEELLAHLRTHTALPGGLDSKPLSAYPSSAASCHLHLPQPGSPGTLPSSFSLRGSPGLSLARYHPYSKAHLPGAPGLPMHSLQASSPYYSPYAIYSQRLGSASTLGYQ
ncbi:zinc finger protein 703-like [Salvelinus sp. IW2-2015]|uniref:zinc finger protein 703-like n=1 Tax=Salvelinus sp. IW2-2015 TaxID=2691554 RepID=UPI000CDFECD8|nr:zinc finger protein 703-like [Salvelinus alpinus]